VGVPGMSLLEPANRLLISAKFNFFTGDWYMRFQFW
jgi:hypothetical protein